MYESAFDEFRETGEVGPQYLALVGRSLRAVIRRRGIPSPSGNARWSPGEIDDALHDFLAERGVERLAQLYISAVDEPLLRRLVQTAVHRFLADRSRRTRRGKLIRRFRQDLKESPRFRLAAGGGVERWTLADAEDHAASFDEDHLVQLAWTLDLRVVLWSDDAARQGPPADRVSRLLFLEAVLREAGGSLTVAELAAVGERRFVLNADPREVSFDELDDHRVPAVAATEVDVDSSREAGRIWDALTARQRAVLPYLHLPVREAARAMKLGRSSVHAAQQQVRSVLAEALGSNPDAGVVRELTLLAEASVTPDNGRQRTLQRGSPSESTPSAVVEDGDRD